MNYKKTLAGVLAALITLTGCSKEELDDFVQNISNDTEVIDTNKDYVEEENVVEVIDNTELISEVENEIKEKEVMYLCYIKNDTKVYDDTLETNVISEIGKFQKVVITKETDYYYFIEDENGIVGFINNEDAGILPDMFVEVDISSQTVNFYIDNELYMTTPCVTGNGGIHTRMGYFEIAYKAYDTYLKGPGYKSHVYYWMPFDQAIGLHDADGWRSEYGGDIYLTNGSHGCINMPYEAAETIYNNVSAGTKVLVHK